MRILHAVSHAAGSGISSAIELLAGVQAARGHRCGLMHYMGIEETVCARLASSGTSIRSACPPAWTPAFLNTTMTIRCAGREIRSFAPDIVHAHSWDADLICARALPPGVRLVATAHSFSYADWAGTMAAHYAKWGGRISLLTCVSGALKDSLERTPALNGIPKTVIYNAPQESFFHPVTPGERRQARGGLGLGPDDIAVFFAANFHPVKGHEQLARAFAICAAKDARLKLVLAGQDTDCPGCPCTRRKTEAILREAGLGERLTLIQGRDDMRPLYAAADIYAQPSLTEGLSVSLCEAFACGLPCVATTAGGNAEMLENGRSGLPVEAGSPEALAAAIARAAGDSELRAKLATGAKAFAEAHLRPEVCAARYEAAYERALGEKR